MKKPPKPRSGLVGTASRTPHPKCPRCYRHCPEGSYNFDNLCDRCCYVILRDYPEHAAVAGIKASYAAQREMTPKERRIRNHGIDPAQWPLEEETP